MEAYQIKRLLQLVEKEDQRRHANYKKAQRLIARFSGFAPRVDLSDEYPIDITCAGCGTRMRVLAPGPYRCPKRDCAVMGEVRTNEVEEEETEPSRVEPIIEKAPQMTI